MPNKNRSKGRVRTTALSRMAAVVVASVVVSGCAVVSVASTAVSVGVGVVGLGADAVIGTARITGKAVGAAADAVLPGND
ncbi:hypothetical protein [Variovorax sp. PAMC 28711]|uniref:hypothetical protein n=1 Tax=Variovorax sp. PAMC 28711 TaxID=1795631 RepID=UPI00078C2ADF|nr:hypothetical protein [Variovorax sp. PAMC 28711]AMM23763.1 hypothetical protein AX767_04940 [Variovorax sp. PAMC 28711]